MSELIKVVDGRDFRERWDGWFITLDDYEQQLFNLFENHSFKFDESKHECWEI